MSKKEEKKQVPEEEIPEVLSDETKAELEAEEFEFDSLKTQLAAETKRADEMTNLATRLRADFDNYRKRTNETNAKERENGRIDVLEKMIPTLDVIDQALAMIQDDSVKSGVEMIKNQILMMLKNFGIEEIDATGEFNPKIHEAIMRMPCESPEQAGTIKEVFQKGYIMGDRLIRAARVIVYND